MNDILREGDELKEASKIVIDMTVKRAEAIRNKDFQTANYYKEAIESVQSFFNQKKDTEVQNDVRIKKEKNDANDDDVIEIAYIRKETSPRYCLRAKRNKAYSIKDEDFADLSSSLSSASLISRSKKERKQREYKIHYFHLILKKDISSCRRMKILLKMEKTACKCKLSSDCLISDQKHFHYVVKYATSSELASISSLHAYLSKTLRISSKKTIIPLDEKNVNNYIVNILSY
jgi:hypothetical protein